MIPAVEGQETFALGGGSGMTGVIAMVQGGIKIIDGATRTAYGPFLKGQLGSEGGGLTYVKHISTVPYRPVNISISPDGRTALASNFGQYTLPPPPDEPPVPPNPDDLPANASIFRIDGPGLVYKTGYVPVAAEVSGGQSIAFSRKGTRAFYSTSRFFEWEWMEDPYDPGTWDWFPIYGKEIQFLTVTGPGKVVQSGRTLRLPFDGTSGLFGVDTIAVDPLDNYLYVSNQTLSGAEPYVAVVSLWTYRLVKYLDAGTYWDPIAMKYYDYLPTGVSFRENARPLTQIYP